MNVINVFPSRDVIVVYDTRNENVTNADGASIADQTRENGPRDACEEERGNGRSRESGYGNECVAAEGKVKEEGSNENTVGDTIGNDRYAVRGRAGVRVEDVENRQTSGSSIQDNPKRSGERRRRKRRGYVRCIHNICVKRFWRFNPVLAFCRRLFLNSTARIAETRVDEFFERRLCELDALINFTIFFSLLKL